jgi:hypothetical protein
VNGIEHFYLIIIKLCLVFVFNINTNAEFTVQSKELGKVVKRFSRTVTNCRIMKHRKCFQTWPLGCKVERTEKCGKKSQGSGCICIVAEAEGE